jgi:hypothetical protein
MYHPGATLCGEGRGVSTPLPRLSFRRVCQCSRDIGSFTAEYPLEIDDDFWENDDPQLSFQQPLDKPSSVTAFNLWLQLTDFTASALHCFVSRVFCERFTPSFTYSKDIVEHDGPSSGLRAEDILNQLNDNLTGWAEKVPQYCMLRMEFISSGDFD